VNSNLSISVLLACRGGQSLSGGHIGRLERAPFWCSFFKEKKCTPPSLHIAPNGVIDASIHEYLYHGLIRIVVNKSREQFVSYTFYERGISLVRALTLRRLNEFEPALLPAIYVDSTAFKQHV
jgi:hypothetical protein